MADQLAIINDPNFVPFITHGGQCLVTHEDRILIVSTSLDVSDVDATEDGLRGRRRWLKRRGRIWPSQAK